MPLFPDSEYLILKVEPVVWMRRDFGNWEITEQDFRNFMVPALKWGRSLTMRPRLSRYGLKEVVEDVQVFLGAVGAPFVCTLVHTAQLAPDGKKRVVFLEAMREGIT